ncbi:hypothetical protein [Phormidium sp. CCY1219]|uniref:hypothetical protein n=1 Tax=Phormidium sp. CCY1219 TaxID=2886104 RepID=UPI002D1EE392|nr:hypothetical protein [Phormidium sp. CCY1219]MEB3828544.1 hypothetical protein [Phormidium sp. CCY1219]
MARSWVYNVREINLKYNSVRDDRGYRGGQFTFYIRRDNAVCQGIKIDSFGVAIASVSLLWSSLFTGVTRRAWAFQSSDLASGQATAGLRVLASVRSPYNSP